MPLTHLDERVALVVIDLQKGIVGLPLAHPAGEVVGRAARLAKAFRAAGWPVVWVNVAGGAPGRTDASKDQKPPARGADWTELVAELGVAEEDHRVTKRTWGAFTGTALDEYLRGKGVTQIVLAGVATSIGVESTARSAYELGYNVVLAADAMTDMNADAHRNSIDRIFPRLGEVEVAEEVVRRVEGGGNVKRET